MVFMLAGSKCWFILTLLKYLSNEGQQSDIWGKLFKILLFSTTIVLWSVNA